jgi:deoxyribonuclease-4
MKKQTKKQTKSSKSKLLLGCHASITPSILEGLQYAESIGATATQIFLGSNRSASLQMKTKLTESQIQEIRSYLYKSKMCLLIHSIYLLNFCKAPPTSGRVKYMHDNLMYDLTIGAQLGAKCVVLHLGFAVDIPIEVALKNLIANLNYILERIPDGIKLALETSAGRKTELGYTLEQLTLIWNAIKHHGNKKVGICIDTAHIFVSGIDISSVEGIRNYMKRFQKYIGWSNITNFHINDSRYELGARKDEHRGIGTGLIFNTQEGKQSLKWIKTFAQNKKIPMILETHGSAVPDSSSNHNRQLYGYEWEIKMIKYL